MILILSIFLRFWKLGSFPPGFTWDEAAIGYNAWGILTVHRDEWLTRMPLTFRSFGDYKSPLAIYLTAVSEKIFGPTVYAVRFPVALAGVALVAATYFLVKVLLDQQVRTDHREKVALVVMVLVGISPWALHFSMIAFESMIATALAAWGSVFLLRGMRKPKLFPLAGIMYALSLYAYHSAKIVVPLTIIALLLFYRKQIMREWKKVRVGLGIFFVTCVVVSLPLLYVSLFGKASDRFFGSTAIVDANKHLKPLPQVLGILGSHFIAHLSPSYLFFGGEQTYRQSNMKDGILAPIEGIFILFALITVLLQKKYRHLAGLILVIMCISILPATLGNDVPHANRALLGLPWFQVLAGIGVLGLIEWLEKRKSQRLVAGAAVVIAMVVSFGVVRHQTNDARVYATSTALSDLQYGYQTVIEYARSQESSVRKIYLSNHYGQAYIFLLFFKQMSPIDYRGGGLANYVISDRPYEDARGQSNVLIIGTEDEIPGTLGREKEFKYPDGKVVFRVVRQ